MPSVAVTRCARCGATSELPVARGPIPIVSGCPCGGQRHISGIRFRPREQLLSGRAAQDSEAQRRPAL